MKSCGTAWFNPYRTEQYGAKEALIALYPSWTCLRAICSKLLCFSLENTSEAGAVKFCPVSTSLAPPHPPKTGADDVTEAWTTSGGENRIELDTAREIMKNEVRTDLKKFDRPARVTIFVIHLPARF